MTEYAGLVVCGPTRFHAVDPERTALLENDDARALLERIEWGAWRDLPKGKLSSHAVRDRLVKLGFDVAGWLPYELHRLTWRMDEYQPGAGWGAPRCNMIGPGPAMTVDVAIASGREWSTECAKAVGAIDGPTTITTAHWYDTFKHLRDCPTCRDRGWNACADFDAIAHGREPERRPVKARPRVAVNA